MTQPETALPQQAAARLSPIARSWAKRTAVLGALVFAFMVAFNFLPLVRASEKICGKKLDLVGFELVRSQTEMDHIFTDTPKGCRDAKITAMDASNALDLPWFMVVYASFMASAALFQSAKLQQRRWLWGLLAAALALVGDIIETGALLQMTDRVNDVRSWLGALGFGTWLKWFSIAGFAGLTAALTLHHQPRRWVLGILGALVVVATLAALFSPQQFGAVMGAAIGVHWLSLWVDALLGLRRGQ